MGKWKTVRLGDIAKINMGQSPASETYNDVGKGLPFFQGKTDFQSMYPTIRMFCSAPQKTANKNDILMSVRAPVGVVNIATQNCCIGRGLAAISETENVSYYKYLFYYLRYKENDIANMGVGSTFKAISRKDINMFSIPLPPLKAQQKIADMLDKSSALIELRKAQIDKLDLLIKSQFTEMFGDPESNIMKWTKSPLRNIITKANNGMARRGNDEDGNIVLRLVELQNGYIDYAGPNRIILSESEKQRYLLQDGDFLFARVNGNPDYVGRCAVFKEINEPVYHNDHIIRVHFDETKINGVFASSLFNSLYGRNQMKDKIKTSAGQYTINQEGIGSIIAILPPMDLQNQFVSFVEKVEKQKKLLQQSFEKLEFNYKSLMQKCFRGEIF